MKVNIFHLNHESLPWINNKPQKFKENQFSSSFKASTLNIMDYVSLTAAQTGEAGRLREECGADVSGQLCIHVTYFRKTLHLRKYSEV